MNKKRPYTHILKNLFHEQATELIPLLMPGHLVKQVLDVEMPEIKMTETEVPPDPLAEGIVGLVLPEARITGVIQTEWIEHSGNFERAYLVHSSDTDKLMYLLIEFQIEREVEDLPRVLVSNYASMLLYARKDARQEDEIEDDKHKRKRKDKKTRPPYFVSPIALCRFPQAVPAHIRDTFQGEVTLIFNFKVLGLWEKDAREMLNTHVSASYFLLPAMKNADSTLLGLAIEELAQQFQSDEIELGRHLTGLSLMLQQSEVMSEEEKLATQEHLKPFMHLIKSDPYEEE